MARTQAPIQAPLGDKNGIVGRIWALFFTALGDGVSGVAPFPLQSVTVANLPTATISGQIIYVSDESGGATVAFSDGTHWRRVQDRAIVS
jgi:hypothetical protein